MVDSYSNQGWFGDGIKYEIYSLENENDISVSLQKDEDSETVNKVSTVLENIDIKKPVFSQSCSYYKDNDHDDYLYIIYDSSQKELYILQELQ